MSSTKPAIEDMFDISPSIQSQRLLDTFNHYTPLTQINPTQPTLDEWSSLVTQLARPSPVVRSAVLRHISFVIQSTNQVPEILITGIGSILIAKAIVELCTIKEKDKEKLRKYNTMYQVMNRYAITLVADIITMIKRVPPVWTRAIVEALESVDPRDTALNDVFHRLIVEMAICCPQSFGGCGSEALQRVFNKRTEWTSAIIDDILMYSLNSPTHKKYLGIDQLLLSLIAPMSDPEHWVFPMKTPSSHTSRNPKEHRFDMAVDVFFGSLKTWQGLLSLTSSGGIGSLVLALRSPVPRQINTIITKLYSLFNLKPPSFKSQRLDYASSASDNSILQSPQVTIVYFTHLLVALIDSNFFDGLCDVCIARHHHDYFPPDVMPHSKPLDKRQASKHRTSYSETANSRCSPRDNSRISKKLGGGTTTTYDESITSQMVAAKSVVLLGELLYLAGVLLPHKHLSLQKLFATACNFASQLQIASSSLLVNLHTHIQVKIDAIVKQHKNESGMSINDYFYSDTTSELKQTMKGLTTMDESEVRRCLQSSNYVAKDYVAWNWAEISKLLTSLSQSSRFYSLVEKTNFFRSLIRFYQPSKKQFSEIDYQKCDARYSSCGLTLFKILVQTDSGQTMLQPIFLEIAAELKSFVQMASKDKKGDDKMFFESITERGHFFDHSHLMKKLSREYFGYIGCLSDMKEAHGPLNEIFDLYVQVLGNKRLNPLSDLISSSFKISTEDKNTKVIEAMLKSENLTVTNRAIKEIGRLLGFSYETQADLVTWRAWTIPTLIENLQKKNQNKANIRQIIQILSNGICKEKIKTVFVNYVNNEPFNFGSPHTNDDQNPQVKSTPISVNESRGVLDKPVIKLDFNVLIENNGEAILYELLLTDKSMKICAESTDFIETEYEKWITKTYYLYLQATETKGHLPHFFKILASTPTGCKVLKDHDTINILYEKLREAPHLNVKAGAIIALAYIASTPLGYELIDEQIIMEIIETRNSDLLYLRGISTWALTILAENPLIFKKLSEVGWIKCYNGIVIPEDGLNNTFYNQTIQKQLIQPHTPHNETMTKEQLELLATVQKMRHKNMVKGTIKTITKKRGEKPELFTTIDYSLKVSNELDCVFFGAFQRYFIYDAFFGDIPLVDIKNYIQKSTDGSTIEGIQPDEIIKEPTAPTYSRSSELAKKSKRTFKSQHIVLIDE
ncbi:Cytosolic regulator pianissimo [Entamoeba marina]